MLASESLRTFVFELHDVWFGVVLGKFYHEVVYLVSLFIKLVLAKEDRAISSTSAVVLKACGHHWSLRIYDQLGILLMTLNSELQAKCWVALWKLVDQLKELLRPR